MRKNYLIILIIFIYACNKKENVSITNNAELVLPGLVNTELFEMNTSFSKSGNEFYYSIADPFQNFNAILSVKKENKGWSNPEVISFSGQYSDFDPFVSYDGNRMYFCSRRPLATGNSERNDANIWFVEKDGNNWSEPQALNADINSEYNEYYVSVSKQGNIFFSSTRPDGLGSWDIYYSVSEKVFNAGESINTEYREWDPFIAEDESFIIFTSDRTNGFGGGDLYISFKNKDGNWSTPQNLGDKVNTSDYEYCPHISRDKEYLYFSRFGGSSFDYDSKKKRNYNDLKTRLKSTDNGLGSIYRIKLSSLDVFNNK